jgi:hypothetical protein
MNIETARKVLNKQQTKLREIMMQFDQHEKAVTLFLAHHAMLHAAKVVEFEHWSYEDAILNDMDEAQIRRIPHNQEHSVAWLLWHMARIEDVTMNLLIAGTPQVITQGNWLAQMKITISHTGNLMIKDDVVQLSNVIDVDALRAYRVAVGKHTQGIVKELQPADLKQKIKPQRLQQVLNEKAVVKEAVDLLNYWGKRNLAGLLLMPATRHNIVHLNEAYRLKNKV